MCGMYRYPWAERVCSSASPPPEDGRLAGKRGWICERLCPDSVSGRRHPSDSQQQPPGPTEATRDPARGPPGSPTAASAQALIAQLSHQQQDRGQGLHHFPVAMLPPTPAGAGAPASGSPLRVRTQPPPTSPRGGGTRGTASSCRLHWLRRRRPLLAIRGDDSGSWNVNILGAFTKDSYRGALR